MLDWNAWIDEMIKLDHYTDRPLDCWLDWIDDMVAAVQV